MAGPMGGPKPGGAKAKDFKGSLLRSVSYTHLTLPTIVGV